jgi:hypothetical protein
MTPRLLAACLGIATALCAQSPLNTIPTPTPTQWFLWTGCVTPTVFFNLTVNTPVTIQGLDVSLDNLAGAEGTVDMFVTTTATTHVGNETNINAWTLRGSGPVVAVNQVTPVRVTFANGFVLNPGNYGVAIRYTGVRAEFLQGTTPPTTFSTAEMTLTPDPRIDAEGFRAHQRESLEELAHRSADEVKRTRRPTLLPPLSPGERRLVHLALAEDPEVETESEGDGFLKRVAVKLKAR